MKKYVVLVCVMLVFISFYACTHKPQGAIDGVAVVKVNNTTNTDTTTDVIDTSVCFQRDVLHTAPKAAVTMLQLQKKGIISLPTTPS